VRAALLATLLSLASSSTALASGLGDHGEDLFVREKTEVKLSGYFRVRGDLYDNLDLDRGTTPSGQALFPVPLSDPNAQVLTAADMRLRTDLAIYAPFAAAAVKVRADLIDNLTLGATPALSPGTGAAPTPAASAGQLPASLLKIKRAYGEALTPFGYLAAGRMGNQWGLGMFANGGDCLDCNSGDANDRVVFATAIAQHLWAVAYDFSAVETTSPRQDGARSLILDPSTNVHSISFAVMNLKDDPSRRRRRLAGKWTLEYGGLASYRWQQYDAPQTYLSTSTTNWLTPSSVMVRGYEAGAFDVWVKLTTPGFRLELEGALLMGQAQQASLIPGVLLRDPVQSFQGAAALESQVGAPEARVVGGLNGGFASGDPAPGFGAYPTGTTAPKAGELDGPQVNVPRDTRIDNFRFNPDYRIDRILFAEIIGTVTDAIYVKPWARARLMDFHSAQLNLKADATWMRAVYASSTPNNDPALGLELHAALTWDSKDGFNVMAEYAVLFPLAGLDNTAQHLTAQPAQLARLRLAWIF
jgi:uncharacterized protein (TIGR04551 family)